MGLRGSVLQGGAPRLCAGPFDARRFMLFRRYFTTFVFNSFELKGLLTDLILVSGH